MKSKTRFPLFIIGLFMLAGCNMATPENYFDRAVLNFNMVQGFADVGMKRELDQPSGKMVNGNKDEFATMKRKEELDQKIQYLDESFEKVKALKKTEDAKDILQTSIALYNYVLPVYKNEYTQLATAYDNGAVKEETDAKAQAIHDKYFEGYRKLYGEVEKAGKAYATRHKIEVHWN